MTCPDPVLVYLLPGVQPVCLCVATRAGVDGWAGVSTVRGDRAAKCHTQPVTPEEESAAQMWPVPSTSEPTSHLAPPSSLPSQRRAQLWERGRIVGGRRRIRKGSQTRGVVHPPNPRRAEELSHADFFAVRTRAICCSSCAISSSRVFARALKVAWRSTGAELGGRQAAGAACVFANSRLSCSFS